VSITMTKPVPAGTSTTGNGGGDKDFSDFLGGILSSGAETLAQEVGIDPRLAGQTVSQVLNIFGIGGAGKAFAPTLPREQIMSQIQQILSPYISDPPTRTLLETWLKAAVEPIQAQKAGKAYQPDMSKSWLTDAVSSVGGAISDVASTVSDALSSSQGQQAVRAGLQVLPWLAAAL
jgi:hypothetical protein